MHAQLPSQLLLDNFPSQHRPANSQLLPPRNLLLKQIYPSCLITEGASQVVLLHSSGGSRLNGAESCSVGEELG